MAEKEQKTQKKIEKNTEVEELNQVDSSRNNELTAELDGLLDEIDEVLETNAEEFVKNYVQKGGE
ncbi:MAG: ubiquitin-like protein Pup [Acidimicrobiaceae bacterium]|nr:ubiquitin-like protein Pup [Acidimicrobiaceae bacterium]|tara:strand:- start:139 stop:333 length:195 start_codon:yes stop_codon:yes gene_type:complete